MAARLFYGWWIVAACLLIAILSWGLGVFGAGVSLHAITQTRGLSVGSVSTAITMSGILSAIATFFVGPAIDRYGPRPVMAFGALVMATGLALIGQVQTLPHVYGAFILSGLGNACLSVTAITAAISPWFEKYQGRAMSSAMLGASVGGMSSTPILLLGVEHIGFPATMLWGRACSSPLCCRSRSSSSAKARRNSVFIRTARCPRARRSLRPGVAFPARKRSGPQDFSRSCWPFLLASAYRSGF